MRFCTSVNFKTFKTEENSVCLFTGLEQRSTVLIVFIALSAFGTLFFLLLRKVKSNVGRETVRINTILCFILHFIWEVGGGGGGNDRG